MNTIAPEEIWRTEISRRLEQGDGLEFSSAQFAQAVVAKPDDPALLSFLDSLLENGGANRIDAYRCPVELCGRALPATGTRYTSCPVCNTDYEKEGLEAVPEQFYRLSGENSRDIRWIIVIHGMNSRAQWQEEFSWQIANRLRYSAPILIYKYGWATIDVLVARLHRRLAKRLGERMRIAILQAAASGRPTQPDIIAHSFGTRLLSLVLEDEDFADLRFGRVITAGSIVRPDFDWDSHLATGRIEAVLNHVGGRDRAVPFAQFAIPGSGPGGTVGYDAPHVHNVKAPAFAHSGFFEREKLRAQIADGGLWHNFLTHPLEHFKPEGTFVRDSEWTSAPLLVRAAARGVGYIIFVLVAPISWARRRIDP